MTSLLVVVNTRGSGYPDISVSGASYAVAVNQATQKIGRSFACGVSLRYVKRQRRPKSKMKRQKASQCSNMWQIFPLIKPGSLSEQPEPRCGVREYPPRSRRGLGSDRALQQRLSVRLLCLKEGAAGMDPTLCLRLALRSCVTKEGLDGGQPQITTANAQAVTLLQGTTGFPEPHGITSRPKPPRMPAPARLLCRSSPPSVQYRDLLVSQGPLARACPASRRITQTV
jgi:hypothetical protein